MSGRFVRASKYRHVFGRSSRKEQCYDNLRISKNAWDTNLVKANPQYISVNWESSGGGAFAVIPLHERGKLPEHIPLFRGHTATVLDTDWSPFDDSLIASASDDAKVCIWKVPEGFTVRTDEEEPQEVSPSSKLAGHSRKVGHVLFNSAAANVLASASGDYTVKIWDIEKGSCSLTLKQGDIVQSLSWNARGSLLVTTSRDKKLRIWDVRQERPAQEVPGHPGAKNSRAVWMGEHDRVASTGFSKMSDRQLGLWDVGNAKEPIGGFQILDSISGVCMPFWDDGTQCLYLAGRGDGNIRYFEYEHDKFEFLSEYKSADPQRGIAFLPKRAVNTHENEVMRAFKTVNDSYVEPISFIVPRRAEVFQDDIYPPAIGSRPAASAGEWFDGKDGIPPKIDLESLYNGNEAAVVHPDHKSTTASTGDRSAPPPAKEEKQRVGSIEAPTPSAPAKGPLQSTKDIKSPSIFEIARKYQNEDDDDDEAKEEEDRGSSFDEVPYGAQRTIAVPSNKAESSKDSVQQDSAPSKKELSNHSASSSTPMGSKERDSAPEESAPPSSTATLPSIVTNANNASKSQNDTTTNTNEPIQTSLDQIKSLLEEQNRTIAAQTDRIGQLTTEVDTLKTRMMKTGESKDVSDGREKEKEERIKELEAELEQIRS